MARRFPSNDPFYGIAAPWNWWVGLSFPYPPNTHLCWKCFAERFHTSLSCNLSIIFFSLFVQQIFRNLQCFYPNEHFSSMVQLKTHLQLYGQSTHFIHWLLRKSKALKTSMFWPPPPKHNFFICLHCSPKYYSTWTILLPCLIVFIWNEITWSEISNKKVKW